MTELSDPRIGIMLEGRYRLAEKLAAGGMGVVYKGEHVAIGKTVAVKFLHDAFSAIPDLVKRFQREAQAMSRLAHPHLVSVSDSGLANGVPFLVMDFVSGQSLAEVLAGGALPAERAVGLARQILAGVKAAHASGVVHRDLKPDNIILLADVEGDFVKILDFGLAKVVQGGGESATQLTNTGFALGTPGYMSPEQAKGTEADERADLYAVGVILYHMVTGRKPFVADSPLAVLRMHMDDAPAPPTTVARGCCSSELEKVILRAMAKDPKARWQTAADFARALAATPEAQALPAAATIEEPVPRRRFRFRPPRFRRWMVRPLLALVVVGAAAYGWSRLSHRDQQKMKRRLDDAVKMAQGAYESVKSVGADQHPPPPKPPASKPTVAPPKPTVASSKPAPPPTPPAPSPTGATPAPVAETKPAPPPPLPSMEAKPAAPVDEPSDEEEEDDADEPMPPKDTPGAKLEEAHAASEPARPTPTPKGPSTKEARAQLAAGKVDQAIQTLYAVRRHNPHAAPAETALLLGHAYFKKLWRTDGLREYDTALKLLPSVRWDHPLVRNTVSALEAANTYRFARAVIRIRLGTAALPELRRVARSAKNPRTRARAARLAQQLQQAARRR